MWSLTAGSSFPSGTSVDPLTGVFHGTGGALVIRFNPRQLAEWVDDVVNDALKLGGLMDDQAREYAQRVAPFTTLTDEEMAALDALPPGRLPARAAAALAGQHPRRQSPQAAATA